MKFIYLHYNAVSREILPMPEDSPLCGQNFCFRIPLQTGSSACWMLASINWSWRCMTLGTPPEHPCICISMHMYIKASYFVSQVCRDRKVVAPTGSLISTTPFAVGAACCLLARPYTLLGVRRSGNPSRPNALQDVHESMIVVVWWRMKAFNMTTCERMLNYFMSESRNKLKTVQVVSWKSRPSYKTLTLEPWATRKITLIERERERFQQSFVHRDCCITPIGRISNIKIDNLIDLNSERTSLCWNISDWYL